MDGAKEHLRATLEARGLHVDSVEISILPTMSGNNSMAFTGQRNGQSSGDYANALPNYGQTSTPSEEAIVTSLPEQPARATDRSAASRLDYRA